MGPKTPLSKAALMAVGVTGVALGVLGTLGLSRSMAPQPPVSGDRHRHSGFGRTSGSTLRGTPIPSTPTSNFT